MLQSYLEIRVSMFYSTPFRKGRLDRGNQLWPGEDGESGTGGS